MDKNKLKNILHSDIDQKKTKERLNVLRSELIDKKENRIRHKHIIIGYDINRYLKEIFINLKDEIKYRYSLAAESYEEIEERTEDINYSVGKYIVKVNYFDKSESSIFYEVYNTEKKAVTGKLNLYFINRDSKRVMVEESIFIVKGKSRVYKLIISDIEMAIINSAAQKIITEIEFDEVSDDE